jgi:endonuclease III related protein
MPSVLNDVYDRLLARFGPQRWWPGDSPFEVMLGAVLVQNTSWKNVELAIGNLREAGVLDPHRLDKLPQAELEELIRPAGYFRVKARRLRNLLSWLVGRHGGSLEALAAIGDDALREELLEIHGIGPETADSILLYALARSSFVVDAYTARVFARHGWIDAEADYHQIQEYFQGGLVADAAMFNEYHALLVRLGKEYCRKTPKCEGCPLEDLLPAGGPCGG